MLASIFCSVCKHLLLELDNNKLACKAYTKTIPRDILYSARLHNKVLPDQEDNYIFTPKEGYENYVPEIRVPEKDDDPPLVVSLSEFRETREKAREDINKK